MCVYSTNMECVKRNVWPKKTKFKFQTREDTLGIFSSSSLFPTPPPQKEREKIPPLLRWIMCPHPFWVVTKFFFETNFFVETVGFLPFPIALPPFLSCFFFYRVGGGCISIGVPQKKKIEIESCCVGLEPLSRLVYYFTCWLVISRHRKKKNKKKKLLQ